MENTTSMRHVKQAKRIDNGEFVKGYYWEEQGNYYIGTYDGDFYDGVELRTLIEVDPATVKDIAVKPNTKWIDGYGNTEYCPHCDKVIYHESYEYCNYCGQRLEW